MARLVQWSSCRKYELERANEWYEHAPQEVVELWVREAKSSNSGSKRLRAYCKGWASPANVASWYNKDTQSCTRKLHVEYYLCLLVADSCHWWMPVLYIAVPSNNNKYKFSQNIWSSYKQFRLRKFELGFLWLSIKCDVKLSLNHVYNSAMTRKEPHESLKNDCKILQHPKQTICESVTNSEK